MTQLILDTGGVELSLPESRKGGYTCTVKPLSVDTEMASGRLTRELRGSVYIVSYQYGFLTEQQKNDFITACEKGWRETITCGFLSQNSEAMLVSDFLVTDFTYPKYMWSRKNGTDDVPLWGDFRVTLREVEPHD